MLEQILTNLLASVVYDLLMARVGMTLALIILLTGATLVVAGRWRRMRHKTRLKDVLQVLVGGTLMVIAILNWDVPAKRPVLPPIRTLPVVLVATATPVPTEQGAPMVDASIATATIGTPSSQPEALPQPVTPTPVSTFGATEVGALTSLEAQLAQLSPGPKPYDAGSPEPQKQDGNEGDSVGGASVATGGEKRDGDAVNIDGNLITCLLPPFDPREHWLAVYRLDDQLHWQAMPSMGRPIDADGHWKIDSLPVDVDRFGPAGEPYKLEVWVNGAVVLTVGDPWMGQAWFRVRPETDNFTPWKCPFASSIPAGG